MEAPPPGYDPVSHVSESLASVPWTHRVSVVLELPEKTARTRLPELLGILTPIDEGRVRLDARVESLDWTSRVLAGLGCEFTIEQPDELRAKIAAVARSLQESAHRAGVPVDAKSPPTSSKLAAAT